VIVLAPTERSAEVELVSVIIPAFNYGRYLPEAIESALNQEHMAREVIVVDDGSTDDSGAVVSRYGAAVTYIRQANAGLSAARNTGIRAARGSYIALLDADDSWSPRFLSTVLALWRDRPVLGAVHSGFRCIDEGSRPLPQVCVSTVPDGQMYDRLLDGEFFVPSSVVTRRDCFDRVGLFDERLRGSEDWDMWLRVARQHAFAGIAEPLVNYRIHGQNMSASPEYMLRYQRMVVEKHFGPAEGPPQDWPVARQRAFAATCRYAAQGHYFCGNPSSSAKYLRLALEANPALCASVDMYYDLAWADQPLGRRNAGRQANVVSNAAFLIRSLADAFSRNDASSRLRPWRSRAFGNAYLALGMVAYGSGRLDLARRYMAKALLCGPALWRDGRAWGTLAKATAGRRVLGAARAWRRERRHPRAAA
jgi:glycosyltransferase involved in cell wall biosynthesis